MDQSERLERLRRLSPAQRELLLDRLREERGPEAGAKMIPRRTGTEPCLLSFAQRQLWLVERLTPGTAAYHVPIALRLEGELEGAVLEDALREIVRRHEVLRTRIVLGVDGEPLQAVDPESTLPVLRCDLSGIPEAERAVAAARLAEEEVRRPFDLERGQPVRALLLCCGPRLHVLVLTLHHIASDGWSDGVLLRELAELYQAFRRGQPSPLLELPIQYADFAVWQRQRLQGETLAELVAYWRRQLAGAPPLLELPTDRPRAAVRTQRGATLRFSLGRELSRELEELARARRATLFMVLLALCRALFYRHTGQSDFVVGTPVANRRPETEALVGYFVNTLALRDRIEEDATFDDLVRAAQATSLGAFEHQDLPFEKLVEELRLERSLGHTPLFQVMLALQNAERHAPEMPELRLEPFGVDAGAAKLDLTFAFQESGEGIQGSLEYATDLFDAATAGRLVERLRVLAADAVVAPDRPVEELPVLTPAEQRAILAAWEAEAGGRPRCLHGELADRAREAPDTVALSMDGEQLTYGALGALSGRLAAYLRALGVGPEMPVGLCLERSPALIIAIAGILKAGGAYLPLDPASPGRRLSSMLADAGAPVLLTSSGLLAEAPIHAGGTVLLDKIWARLLDPAAEEEVPADPAQTAYVIYTSGSTGKPKGAAVSHTNVARLFTSTAGWFGFDRRDVWTLFHSVSFDFSVWEIWGALLHGGRLEVVPRLVGRAPDRFRELLAREGVTVLNQTPSSFRQLIQDELMAGRSGLPALRLVIFGGEVLEPRSLRPWVERHGDRQPRLVNMYGITETTVHVTYQPVTAAMTEEAAGSPVGVPLPDLSVFVLDRRMQPVPTGTAGELYVGGPGLSRGYLGRPDLTGDRFRPCPFGGGAGARLYRTGDLGRRRADGALDYLGRVDQQVKVRGFRIEPGEIEAVLAEHERVRQAVVVARATADDVAGSRLVAYVVTDGEGDAGEELRRFLALRLPDYMVPAICVRLEALPLTANGKVDRAALPEPEWRRPKDAVLYVAPGTPEELLLTEVWSEVLGIARVGIDDGFFAVGGDSMRGVQVQVRTLQRGYAFRLQDLYAHPTIRELAPCLSPATEDDLERDGAPDADEELLQLLTRVEELSEEGVGEELRKRATPEVESR